MPANSIALIPFAVRTTPLRRLASDRPTYNCPICGECTMQFFRRLPETSESPERINAYVCFACGHAWEM